MIGKNRYWFCVLGQSAIVQVETGLFTSRIELREDREREFCKNPTLIPLIGKKKLAT
jgi:hypothetical protein